MILSVEVILPLVKVSIFPLMTSMVEKLPVLIFAVPLTFIVLMVASDAVNVLTSNSSPTPTIKL